MSVIHIKIKIKNPTYFGHSYSTIIRGSQCLCIYYYQYACNISYAYVAVCYLCAYLCGVLTRMVSARVQYTSRHHTSKHTSCTDTQVTHSHIRV
jgi:hypothetical protein